LLYNRHECSINPSGCNKKEHPELRIAISRMPFTDSCNFSFSMHRVRKAILYTISPFARVANKVNWRVGRPYKKGFDTIQPHIGRLAPGMIILSHKDYELTNWFISGYWTHVAVIASENTIIEAVSKGVIKTRINEFFSSIDDFIIIEPTFCSRASMLKAVEYMERYIGYPYNFNFLQSDQSFTCIDLVCRAYSLSIHSEKRRASATPGLIGYITQEVIMPESILNLDNAWSIITQTHNGLLRHPRNYS
jgi:hypothetical protein